MTFLSCKKNKLGGSAEIKGVVMHHPKSIGGATVYIKFNAKEYPGSSFSSYDATVNADINGNYSFKVYQGDYYLYAVGYDEAIPAPNIVQGGLPIHIRNREVVESNIPVTE